LIDDQVESLEVVVMEQLIIVVLSMPSAWAEWTRVSSNDTHDTYIVYANIATHSQERQYG
jgi:hypothetical protein